MTDKELHKLKKAELLETLYYLRVELDKLTTENELLKQQLEERNQVTDTMFNIMEKMSVKIDRFCENYQPAQADNVQVNELRTDKDTSERSGGKS